MCLGCRRQAGVSCSEKNMSTSTATEHTGKAKGPGVCAGVRRLGWKPGVAAGEAGGEEEALEKLCAQRPAKELWVCPAGALIKGSKKKKNIIYLFIHFYLGWGERSMYVESEDNSRMESFHQMGPCGSVWLHVDTGDGAPLPAGNKHLHLSTYFSCAAVLFG